ncbi:MAG TPA: RHS repeat-associated core domain-containing protein, partial [Flavobacterium sp.]
AGNTLSGFVVLDRGYTGHEHLQGVNLIHMNARLYDPVLHRFLQPDNFIQDPYNTQNYNRYAYVLNNPLKYTDPSGEEYNNCIECGEGGGMPGYQQTLIGAGIGFVGTSWDKLRIKDWANRNIGFRQFGDGLKSAGNFIANGISSIFSGFGNFLERRLKSGASASVPLPPTPAISNHQLSSGWQNEGFGNSGMNYLGHNSFDMNVYDYTNNGEIFKSQSDLENYVNKNIGNLNAIEKALNVDITLASKNNLPPGYSMKGNDLINDRGGRVAGTTSNIPGHNNSIIYMAPSVKGDFFGKVGIASHAIAHELLHANHFFLGLPNTMLYTEAAASTFTFAYLKAYGSRNGAMFYYPNIKKYPQSFSWKNLPKIINIGIK